MKNPHLNSHCKILNTVSGDKKFKRKSRDPIKRVSEDHLPYFKLYKNSHLMPETLGDACPKETSASEIDAASVGNEILNTAIDMRINTVISGEIPDSKLRSISEKTVNSKLAQTNSHVSALSGSQVFPLSVLCFLRAQPRRRLTPAAEASARSLLGDALESRRASSRRSKPFSRREDFWRTRAKGRACTPSVQPLRRSESR